MRLADKIAVVTGSGRGIGRAISLALAREGAHVVVNDIDLQVAKEVANEIRALGRRAIAVKADVSNGKEVNDMVNATLKEFGRVDILVNNAGIAMIAPSEDLSEENWDRAININLKGVFLCSQAFGREMIKQKGGKIVNIAAIAGMFAAPDRVAYNSSKAGVILLTKTLAVEWAKYNINVNAVAPAVTKTDMVRKGIAEGLYSEETIAKRFPIGRLLEPEEIANVGVFLASEESSCITGHTIVADGGWTAYSWF